VERQRGNNRRQGGLRVESTGGDCIHLTLKFIGRAR
jgi:hypothetical protein